MITKSVKLDPANPDQAILSEAAGILRRGGLVAFPTETVYGLGINASSASALKAAYDVKGREEGKPFSIVISSKEDLLKYNVSVDECAIRLMDRFWPGPLTLVLPIDRSKKTRAGADLAEPLSGIIEKIGSIGFRMPDNLIALKFIEACAITVAAPSANLSGKREPVCAEDVMKDLGGKIEMVLDGGKTKIGKGSTVVSLAGDSPKILREGAISAEEIYKYI